mgnify:CR=1 FL=1
MDNLTDVVKDLVLKKFNECVQGGQAQSVIDANIAYIANLILNDYKPEVTAYMNTEKERLVAEKATLPKQKLDAEATYDKFIKIVDDAQVEIQV